MSTHSTEVRVEKIPKCIADQIECKTISEIATPRIIAGMGSCLRNL